MDNRNWLIGLVLALLIFVMGTSLLFNVTKSERSALAGGGILFLIACLVLKVNGWL